MSDIENVVEKIVRKKKIVLQCSCNFARTGMEALISAPMLCSSLEIVAGSSSFEESETLLGCLPSVDIVLLMLSHGEYSLASFLQFIGDSLPQLSPSCTVVLVGDVAYINVLKRYFSGMRNVLVTLDNTTSLMKMQTQLFEIDRIRGSVGSNSSTILTSRELLVLRRLLDGESSRQIADDLALHYKTVSHHKRAALTKMGIRSLCSLVMHKYNDCLIHPQTRRYKHGLVLR
ncbi:transcriptional regulator FimZ [Serratia fonticola]|uniref:LuxR C-terminal-related transcriptional regulator n=1 Tax=Serratia fonticola TaxID=47917 RepID=UPI00217BDEC3|nr:LuxR C-terminal-related transcriptional regulator [Serratia fonticola]CAI2039581.1 transcriptional regulator FimZ [Serratia fonticola]